MKVTVAEPPAGVIANANRGEPPTNAIAIHDDGSVQLVVTGVDPDVNWLDTDGWRRVRVTVPRLDDPGAALAPPPLSARVCRFSELGT